MTMLAGTLPGGCSSTSSSPGASAPAAAGQELLTPERFRVDVGATGTAPAAPAPKKYEPLSVQVGTVNEGIKDVAVLAGDPKAAIDANAQPQDQPVVLDALIGQINGKPIYASRFLAPLEERLRAKRSELRDNRAWTRAAGEIIARQLFDKLRDELFLAEARAELSPEQRAGLFYFLNSVRDTLASNYGGSREEADTKIQEKEGQTFEGKVEAEKNQALIKSIIGKYIVPRVNVAWRDVTRQYERDYKTFNPPPVAMIRLIYVDAGDAPGVQAVTDALAAGTPFIEASNLPANVYPKGAEGVVPATLDGDISKAKLFLDPALNANANKLTPGGIVGPFDYRTPDRRMQKVWMHLEEVRQAPGVSLEDVQLKIYAALRDARFNEEVERFLRRLQERASFTAVPEMTERLLLIAQERYLVAERAR
ncbi:MAG: peptidylprolyl isomerase [Polaromonas sp.]